MPAPPLQLTIVSLHTSPLDAPGTKDAGGMNVVVRAQATELARRGHHVRLVTRRSDPGQPDAMTLEPRLTVHHLDVGQARLLAKHEHEALVAPFGAALREHLRDHPADLLHAQHWYSGLAALPVARELRVPLVQSYHSIAADEHTPLAEGERAEAPGRRAAERLLAQQAALTVTVSAAERETVIARLGAAPDRVRVVAPGIDTQLFQPKAETERLPGHEPHAKRRGETPRAEMLVVGRLDPLKRFELAIGSMAAIPSAQRPLLRIIGAAPPAATGYAQQLRDAVAAAHMHATTSFEGALSRLALAERLRQASLVLVPSHSETYGLVALEAAASGVPVIAADRGGLREAVIDGVTGVLLASEDPAHWARTITRLLADPQTRIAMGRAARAHATQHSWARAAARLLACYRELLDR